MKLKTELRVYGPDEVYFDYTREDVIRDAQAAHALMSAIEWYEKSARYGHVPPVAAELIKRRAIEIMDEWGLS